MRWPDALTWRRARQLVADHDRALRRLDANVNARLLAEVLLLDWPRAERVRKEEQWLTRPLPAR